MELHLTKTINYYPMQSFLRQGCLEGKVMDDLISREAILKHIEKIRQDMQMMDDTYRASIVMTGMHLCERVVRSQPPAQPDIIQCRNCKFASGDSRICMKFGHSPIGELDFCAWAERRTDGRD